MLFNTIILDNEIDVVLCRYYKVLPDTKLYQMCTLKPGFHIVVTVISVVRKKFIGQIEFILSCTTVVSVISFVLSICTGGFHKVVSVL